MILQKKYISTLKKNIFFDAWISPEMTIAPITKIECNPVVGGIFKLYSESPSGTGIMSGEFKEVIRDKKLIYTWCWEGSDEKTEVTVTFTQDSGNTVIALRHSGFLSEESKALHSVGWDNYFNVLESRLKALKNNKDI